MAKKCLSIPKEKMIGMKNKHCPPTPKVSGWRWEKKVHPF
jgi:hypothetical protein